MNLTLRRIVPSLAFLLILAAAAFAEKEKPAEPKQGEPENSGRSIWTQNVTGFRKEHGAIGGYKRRWDLSDLPHYVPKQKLSGTIRIWGNNYIKDGDLGRAWVDEFK